MPKIKNLFVRGVMDKDTDRAFISQGLYRHAENLRFQINDGNDGIGNNIKGTLKVSDSTENRTDLKCITALHNEDLDVIYYYLASTSGLFSKIVEYDINSGNTVDILHDTLGILNLDKNGYITGINEIDGLLYFSEWGNNPRRINVERAKTYGTNGFTEDDIKVIVRPPLQKLRLTLQNTGTISQQENNIEEKFLSFSYRFRYLDGEYSVLAPFTKFAFKPKPFRYDFSEQSNRSMINSFNQVLIEFDTGSERVVEIQLVFKESESNAVWVIDDFNKSRLGYADNTIREFEFFNNKVYRALDNTILPSFFDNVPRTVKSQEIIDGRLLYGYYKENYDIVDSENQEIEIDYSLELISLPNSVDKEVDIVDEDGNVIGSEIIQVGSLNPKETCKSNRDYEVGIVYGDGDGRITTILNSKTNTIYIPNSESINENSIDVILKNKPPFWATYYRFFIKQNKKGYDQILPTLFYEDGVYRWIKLEGADKDKIKEGDYLIVKSDTQQVIDALIKVKVLEVTQQEKNFLQPLDTTDEIVERAGLYFKIKPQGFRVDIDDYENFTIGTYDNTRNAYNDTVRTIDKYIGAPHFYGDTLNDLSSNSPFTGGSGVYTGANNDRNRYLIKIDSLVNSATGTITCVRVTAGDTVTVNGLVYTAVAGVKADNTEFSIDTSDTACAFDLANSISGDTRIGTLSTQSANNVANVVTVTTDAVGSTGNAVTLVSSNGTRLAVSGTGTLEGGSENTFKWSDDNGATFLPANENIPITAGVAQPLSKGVEITFQNDIGHSLLDEWTLNARSTWTRLNSSRAYGFFRTTSLHGEILEDVEDEVIQNGARIFMEYDEYGRGNDKFTIDVISSARYDNIEEWFYKENILALISGQCNLVYDDIHFMRGNLRRTDNATEISQDDVEGTMTMCIRSVEHGTGTSRVKVRTKTEVIQNTSDNYLLFETEPVDQPADIYYEIGKNYKIINGFHSNITDDFETEIPNIGTDQPQTAIQDLRVKLDWFNAYSYGNAVESYKIRDEFNTKGLDVGVRALTNIREKYQEVTRRADITWSDVYNDETDFNGLNTFNISLINFVKLDKEDGTIQKLHRQNSNLLVLQEDAIGIMPYNKQIINEVDGGKIVGISTNILNRNSYRPYASGLHGISKQPESFVRRGSRSYMTDQQRGNLLRLANDGITEINQNLFEHEFSNLMTANKNAQLVAGFDPKHDEYLINIPSELKSLVFKEGTKGFPSYITFQPDFILGANNECYAWKDGVMYQMHATENRNNFFNVQYSSKLKFFVNQDFSVEKIFNAIGLESTHAWLVNLATKLTSRTIPKECFVKKEDYWFSEIMTNTNDDTEASNILGLGNFAIVDGEIITTRRPDTMCIGDEIISKSLLFAPNKIVDISNDRIILETAITTVSSFLMYKKNQNVDGSNIRGDILEIEMINDDTIEVEIRAVNTEVSKTFYS